MNILILNWRDPKHPNAGGAEQVTLGHAKGWLAAGHSVIWFSARFSGLPASEKIDGVTIVRRGGLYTVYIEAFLYYLAHRGEFDIVVDEIHFIPFFTPLYVRKPIVAFIHEVADKIWDYTRPFPVNLVGKALEKVYFYFYCKVPFWTDATSTVEELEHYGIPKNHCTVIPCPIQNKILASFPRKHVVPTFIYVGRLVKMKGIEDVITAFSYVLDNLPDAQLWIVGQGKTGYVKYLNSLIDDLKISKSVVVYGKLSESQKLGRMKLAHLLLHASVKEGWGLVVLEAASQGTPTVAYNVAGLTDTIRDGKTGILTRANTPQELCRSAVKLYRDRELYRKLQKNGLVWVRSLSWPKAVEQSLSLLNSSL